MANTLFLYLAASLPLIWGAAHLLPTASIVKGFGSISDDNKRIIAMEWIVEGTALIFTGCLLFSVTIIDPTNIVSKSVYLLSFVFLNVLSIVSFKTGFKISFLPFKLCPVIFTTASILILIGLYI